MRTENAHSIIRTARTNHGWSQTTLGKRCSIPACDISQIESGKQGLGKERAERLSEVLNIALETIYTPRTPCPQPAASYPMQQSQAADSPAEGPLPSAGPLKIDTLGNAPVQ